MHKITIGYFAKGKVWNFRWDDGWQSVIYPILAAFQKHNSATLLVFESKAKIDYMRSKRRQFVTFFFRHNWETFDKNKSRLRGFLSLVTCQTIFCVSIKHVLFILTLNSNLKRWGGGGGVHHEYWKLNFSLPDSRCWKKPLLGTIGLKKKNKEMFSLLTIA